MKISPKLVNLKYQRQDKDKQKGALPLPILRQIDVRFECDDKGLGLSIAGGLDSPYKANDEGIFISRVTAGGPAAIAGLLKDDKVGSNKIGLKN